MGQNAASTNLLTRVFLMQEAGVQAVKSAYVQLNEYLNRPPLRPHQIVAYAKDLENYPPQAVVRALEAMRKEPGRRFLPLPWEVVDYMSPQVNPEHAASEIAAQIVSAIGSCGYTNPQKAEKKLGPLGWSVVASMGGWAQLCSSLKHDELNTFRAQARGVAKGHLEATAQRERQQLLSGNPPSLRSEQDTLALSQNEKVSDLINRIAAKKTQGVF